MQTISAQTTKSKRWRGPRVAWAAFLGTAAVVAVVAIVLATDSNGSNVAGDDPASVIQAYTAAYNAGDIDAVMALFSEESVVTGHPFAAESAGLTAIRVVQVADIAAAAAENAYTISNVEVTGDTVTWDHVWTRNNTQQFCVQGHRAVIQDGKILSWVWPGPGCARP